MPQTQQMTTTTKKLVRAKTSQPFKKAKTTGAFKIPRFLGLAQTKTGMPARLKMTHRYTESTRITLSAGQLGEYIFSCNSLYDPNTTGAGHQPMFFDQISAMYHHYTVMKSRIKIQMVPVVASAGCQSYRCCVSLQPTAAGAATMNGAIENPRSNWVLLSAISNTFGPQNRLSLSWDAKKIFGADAIDDPNLSGTPSGNPAEQSYFVFQVQDSQGAGTGAIDIIVVVEYDTEWDEPALVGTS